MNHPYQYIGFFPDPESFYQLVDGLRSHKLNRQIIFPHVTVLYMPEDALQALFGTEAEITVTGYGCDGKNGNFVSYYGYSKDSYGCDAFRCNFCRRTVFRFCKSRDKCLFGRAVSRRSL